MITFATFLALLYAFRMRLELALFYMRSIIRGPKIPKAVREMIRGVKDAGERRIIYKQPLQSAVRLEWVARDRGVSVARILQEISGAGTALGVVIDGATRKCFPTLLVAV